MECLFLEGEFLNPGITDILGWIIVVGAILCLVGCTEASLAFIP